jgi:hypothetical protein
VLWQSATIAPPYLCPYWDISFPCLAAAMCAFFPISATDQIRYLFPSSRLFHYPTLDDEQAVSTVIGVFFLSFFANYIVPWCIM